MTISQPSLKPKTEECFNYYFLLSYYHYSIVLNNHKLHISINYNIYIYIYKILLFLLLIQPERWFRIRKFEVQVPSNSYFQILILFFPQSLSFLQVIRENNVPGPYVYPHTHLAWIGSSPSMCEKQIGAWKIVFLQNPISSHKTIRGHATKKNEPQTNCKPYV